MQKEYSHYYKKVPFDYIDVYRVLDLFSVTDPCLQHAIKKLLVAGGRGHKDIEKDVKEAIVSLERWKEMRKEEGDSSIGRINSCGQSYTIQADNEKGKTLFKDLA